MKFSGLVIDNGKAEFVFYGSEGRKFTEPAVPCKECNGTGDVPGSEPVVDYVNGGYLNEVTVTCEDCEGYGYVVQDDEPEED